MRRQTPAILAMTALAAGLLPLAAGAAPTCPQEVTRTACGGRVVAEPALSTTFVQYGLEFSDALNAIERIAPDLITVYTLDDLTGNHEHFSAGGRQIYIVRVTDENVASDPANPKKDVAVSLSVHANETAGREGAIRYLEDLASWWSTDKTRPMYAGDTDIPMNEVMAETQTWFAFLNPDGWAAGDFADTNGVIFNRGNGTSLLGGEDLNREFPTIGWTNQEATPLSAPEARGFHEFISNLENLTTATDIHGELTTETNSWADLMWPAGQWSPRVQAQELQLAKNMTRTVERKFEENPASIVTATDMLYDAGIVIPATGMKPAEFATAYDIVGYDDGGFMGDYFVSQGAIEIDSENFLSHLAPGNAWVGAYEQAHVIAVRGLIESAITEAMVTEDAVADLDIQRVAYLTGAARVTSDDVNGVGARVSDQALNAQQADYSVSQLDYFADLATDAGVELPGFSPADIAAGADLSGFDSFVIADTPFPGGQYDRAAYTAALKTFAEDGGQLVLTDSALNLLVDLGVVSSGDVTMRKYDGGEADFGDFDHVWEADLDGRVKQMYYAVPLGYSPNTAAPNYSVKTSAWESAGGTTVGLSGNGSATAVGHAPLGSGSVAIFGAILPTPTEDWGHVFGLKSYGVTVNAGKVLHAMLEYTRDGAATQATQATQADAGTTETQTAERSETAAVVATATQSRSIFNVLATFLQAVFQAFNTGNR